MLTADKNCLINHFLPLAHQVGIKLRPKLLTLIKELMPIIRAIIESHTQTWILPWPLVSLWEDGITWNLIYLNLSAVVVLMLWWVYGYYTIHHSKCIGLAMVCEWPAIVCWPTSHAWITAAISCGMMLQVLVWRMLHRTIWNKYLPTLPTLK